MNDDQTLYEEYRYKVGRAQQDNDLRRFAFIMNYQEIKMEPDTLGKYYIIRDDRDKIHPTPNTLDRYSLDRVVNFASSLVTAYPERAFTIFTAERLLRLNDRPILEKKFV